MQMTLEKNLRLEVEREFGRKILSSTDCHELSHCVFEKTGSRLSFNTLRRYFNLMKSNFKPSSNTLHILAKYCGYSSFDQFLNPNVKEQDKQSLVEDEKLLEFLVLLFKNIEVAHNDDITYINVVRLTINFLDQHPGIINRFQQEIAKTKNGQTFYFEYFVNMDKINSYYGDGLCFYLKEKKSWESQLFGHSLLCMRYWLINDREGVERHYREVLKYEFDETIHPFICVRYFTSQLYHANIFGLNKKDILTQAQFFYNEMKSNSNNWHFLPYFHLNIIEALILTNENREALYYIDELVQKFDIQASAYIFEQANEVIQLYQALALARLGKMEKAKEIFNTIQPESFDFLSKHYHTILYLLLKELIFKPVIKTSQLQLLIKETGFLRLLPAV